LRIRPPRPIDGHKGELLFEQDQLQNGRAADALFREALAIAQQQRAKSWELRATTSLARLWSAQSRRREANDLLALLYDWFTEGFDTVPLKEARELLDTLRDTRRFGSASAAAAQAAFRLRVSKANSRIGHIRPRI